MSGWKVGGPARAKALSPARRSAIAGEAALARWHPLRDMDGAIDEPADHEWRKAGEKARRQVVRRVR